jgi:hypothetical protein
MFYQIIQPLVSLHAHMRRLTSILAIENLFNGQLYQVVAFQIAHYWRKHHGC